MKHIAVYEKFENSSSLIESEQSINSMQALQMATKAMENSGKADPSISKAIVDCIKSGRFTHLAVLTTGSGTFALGALTACLASGVGTAPAILVMACGAILMTIEGLLTTSGSGAGSVTDEIESLVSCLGKKGVI
jgi:hypothetical protein